MHHVSPTSDSQVTLLELSKSYDEHTVLDRVRLTVAPGEKVGVVGDNGSGKSTLLRVLAGLEPGDSGEVIVRAPGGIGHLPQTLRAPAGARVRDAVDASLAGLRRLEGEVAAAEAGLGALEGPALERGLDAYAALLARYEAREGYGAEHRVDVALAALGLPGLDRDRPLATLSGGECSRLALAGTLASRPELLLLDEPTNDLDDTAVAWLEDQLRTHRGTVVAVTHDRVFLERLTTTVLEIEAGRVTRHGDGWAGYRTAKAAERRRRLREYEEWRAELERGRRIAESNVARLDAIPRAAPLSVFGHGGFRSRSRGHGAMVRIRNAKERVARLTEHPVAPPPQPLRFTARAAPATAPGAGGGGGGGSGDAPSLAGPLVALDGVRVGERLRVESLRVTPGQRVLVTGPNGAGKTTLLQVIAGELAPDRGEVRVRGPVGQLRQRETPWPPGLGVLDAFAGDRAGTREEHAGLLLSLGLFRPAELRLRVGELSYGQRRRVELARLVTEPADLLLFDEPTNHLSPALVEELEEALGDYPGAVVVVTHDRRLRSRFTGERWQVAQGRVEVVGGR